jgi:hypothetical protein
MDCATSGRVRILPEEPKQILPFQPIYGRNRQIQGRSKVLEKPHSLPCFTPFCPLLRVLVPGKVPGALKHVGVHFRPVCSASAHDRLLRTQSGNGDNRFTFAEFGSPLRAAKGTIIARCARRRVKVRGPFSQQLNVASFLFWRKFRFFARFGPG